MPHSSRFSLWAGSGFLRPLNPASTSNRENSKPHKIVRFAVGKFQTSQNVRFGVCKILALQKSPRLFPWSYDKHHVKFYKRVIKSQSRERQTVMSSPINYRL
jgi:hypothetical protein